MNRLYIFLRGSVELTITGAAQQILLNRLAKEQIPFWNLRQQTPLQMQLCIFRKDEKKTKKMIRYSQCELEQIQYQGLRQSMAFLKKRPLLWLGALLAASALLILPNFVWNVQIVGNESLPTEKILQELRSMQIDFGTWGPSIQSSAVRDQLLNRFSSLRWCAVNRTGGCLTVLIKEKQETQEPETPLTANIVAARTGIIEQMHIYNGFRQCQVGDAVTQGQLLVSGIAEWPMGIQSVCASAEIYALTQHQITTQTPSVAGEKEFISDEMTCYNLIVGRKRINLYGNSGILHTKCDKISIQKQLTLPGGYAFPLTLEIVTIRPYTLSPVAIEEETAAAKLEKFSEQMVKRTMIAGTILNRQSTIEQVNDCYVLTSKYGCREMIARTVPMPIFGLPDA